MDFDRFVREVAVQAEKIQTEHRGTFATDYIEAARERVRPNVPVVRTRYTSKGPSKSIHDRTQQTSSNARGLKRKRDVPDAPLCLNPICRAQGKRHYLSVCNIFDRKTKDTLLKEYRSNKKARLDNANKKDGNVARVSSTSTNPHSSLFKASFGKGEIETDLMADQGADANFISSQMFKKIKQVQPTIQQKNINPQQTYRDVTGAPCLTCKSSAELDVFLQI